MGRNNTPWGVALDVCYGSVFAVQHGLTAAHDDAAVHEAGIGQIRSFDYNPFRLWGCAG